MLGAHDIGPATPLPGLSARDRSHVIHCAVLRQPDDIFTNIPLFSAIFDFTCSILMGAADFLMLRRAFMPLFRHARCARKRDYASQLPRSHAMRTATTHITHMGTLYATMYVKKCDDGRDALVAGRRAKIISR